MENIASFSIEAEENHDLYRPTEETLSSEDKYKYEWHCLTSSLLLENNLEKLRQIAVNGDLKISKFRSICWALLLNVLPNQITDWKQQRKVQRERYRELQDEFIRNPHVTSDFNDDPLSQSQQSVWNQYFGDQELCAVIKQDVKRTFPGVDFFRKNLIQETMGNVLFYYAREHPDMCYRQGMHEILAPILFVVHSDHQALLHFKEISKDIDPFLLEILNPEYFEPDAYSLFSRLMEKIEPYYRITNLIPTAGGYFQTELGSPNDGAFITETAVVGQLNLIRDKILAKEDLHLHNHLLKLDIPLHIFGIRWLRLLFGREFPLQDLLMLWDAIFADDEQFQLPNYIVVAMLIRIRDRLLISDYTTCLTYLMRYPTNTDIAMILKHALYMQSPLKYERPQGAFAYVTMKAEKNALSAIKHSSVRQVSSTLPRKNRQLAKAVSEYEQKENSHRVVRASSLSVEHFPSHDLQLQVKINELQYTNALNAARLANYSTLKANDIGIVDGYREDSAEVLRLELENAQTVIAISRIKLRKYLSTLRSHISRNHSDDLNQALDGIEELCAFLDVKIPITTTTVSNLLRTPVDQAFEVDEVQKQRPHTLALTNTTNQATALQKTNITDAESKKEFVKNLDVQSDAKNSERILVTAQTRYEIPDDSNTKMKVSRIVGSKKDVELTLIKKHLEFNVVEADNGVPSADPTVVTEN